MIFVIFLETENVPFGGGILSQQEINGEKFNASADIGPSGLHQITYL
jgi:hypothetical protein